LLAVIGKAEGEDPAVFSHSYLQAQYHWVYSVQIYGYQFQSFMLRCGWHLH